MVHCSDGREILLVLLFPILSYFDDIDLLPHVPGGPTPILIVDGYQGRLDSKFIIYIDDKNHLWKVCFVVPHATMLWQLGGASEQNGKYKLINTRKRVMYCSGNMTITYQHLSNPLISFQS